MKTLLSFLITLIAVVSYGQTINPCGGMPPPIPNPINRAAYGHFIQSSISSIQNVPTKSVDNDFSTKAKSILEDNPYIQVDLGERYYIPYIKVYSDEDISQFYVFTSEFPISNERSIPDLLNDNKIWSNQTLSFSSGNKIFVAETARYVRIQFYNNQVLEISELYIPGEDLSHEICGNHLDDNCDDRIDCLDTECGINIFNVAVKDASCPICNDGEISIQAFGDNKLFSIDGGITFSDECYDNFEGLCYFNGLIPGEYNIVVKNSETDCQSTFQSEVRSPALGPHGACENGGFEDGNFNLWTGGVGTSVPFSMTNTNINNNFNQTILQTSTFIDPFIPTINSSFQGLGQFIAKLGNTNDEESERLTYCFDVDATNADFQFAYAAVLQYAHPIGTQNLNSFFRWVVYSDDGNPPNIGNILFPPVILQADPNNPTMGYVELGPSQFDLANTKISFQNWTCQTYNLAQFIGQRVCIEFITSDCGVGTPGHFGYAYIDGLCTDLVPAVDLSILNDVYCADQVVRLEVPAGGYDHYKWTISKLDSNNEPINTLIFEEDGDVATIENLVEFYNENSITDLLCNEKVRLKIEVSNQCASNSSTKDIKLNCASYEIDYCNLIYNCLGDPEERMIGINDCENCDITWWPGQYLILDDNKFPLVTAEFFANAFEQTYNVRVISPEGCIWRESIQFEKEIPFTISFNESLNYCDYTQDIVITFENEISNELVNVKAIDIQTSIPYTVVPVDLIEEESTGLVKVFRAIIERDRATQIKAIVEVTPIGQTCNTEDVCSKTQVNKIIPKSYFVDPWTVQLPAKFEPNGNGFADLWYPTFIGLDENCNDVYQNVINNHVYRAKIRIVDRWENVMFEKETSVDPDSEQGIDHLELSWDGTALNGANAPIAVYVATLEIWTCGSGQSCSYYGQDCEWPDYFCSPNAYSHLGFDIQIIR